MATPHLLVMGDNETGKTNMLRLILRSITQRYGPDEAKVVIGDSRRDLDNAIPADYRVGYAVTSEDLGTLAAQTAISMNKRIPGQEVTSDRLRKRALELIMAKPRNWGKVLGAVEFGSPALDVLIPPKPNLPAGDKAKWRGSRGAGQRCMIFRLAQSIATTSSFPARAT